MKLTPEARDVVNEIMAEAHADGRPTRARGRPAVVVFCPIVPSGRGFLARARLSYSVRSSAVKVAGSRGVWRVIAGSESG